MSHHPPTPWSTAARLMLTVPVVGTLLYFVDWRQVLSALAGAELAWLLPAYALVVGRHILEAGQLTFVLRYVGCCLTWFRVFRANSLAALYALFTPGSLIPMAVKWTDLAAATGRRAIVLNAIVYSRLLLDLQPMIIGAVTLAWANPIGGPMLAVAASALATLGVTLAICLFAPGLAQSTRWASGAMGPLLPAGLRTRMDHLLDDLEPFRRFPLTRHMSLAAMALLSLTVGIVVRVMIMKSLGFNVPLSTLIWVEAILLVAGHVPITVANFGVREGLLVAAFGLYGVPAGAAVAYGLFVYSCHLIFALVGSGYQLALIAGWMTMRGNALPTKPLISTATVAPRWIREELRRDI